MRFSSFLKYLGTNFFAKFSDNKKKVVNLFFNRRKERRSRYTMALKNVNIPLNIKDYPTTNSNSSSVYMGVNSLLNNSSSNQNLVTITNYLPSDQSSVNISKMINGIIVGPTTTISNIQNSIIVGSINISSSGLAGSQVSASNILAVGSYLEIPNASNCTILGVGNDPDVQNPLFIIGNGITYSSNHNIVEVTTDSVHISPSRSNAVTVDITGTGVNITGATTISGLLTTNNINTGNYNIQTSDITAQGTVTLSDIAPLDEASPISISGDITFSKNPATIYTSDNGAGEVNLVGTYTFDSANGLKIGTSTINSSNESVNLTLPRYSGTLALAKTLYNYTITFGFETDENSSWNYGGLSGNNSYRGVISFNINLINGTSFDDFLSGENFKEATDNFSDIWWDILGTAAGKSSVASGYILQIVNGEPQADTTSNLYFINNVRGEMAKGTTSDPYDHYILYAFGIRFAQYAFSARADQKYLPILTANTDPSFALPQGVSNGNFDTTLSDGATSMVYQGIRPSDINYISIHKEAINF